MLEGTSGDTERASVAPSLGAATAEPRCGGHRHLRRRRARADAGHRGRAGDSGGPPRRVAVAEAPPTEALVTGTVRAGSGRGVRSPAPPGSPATNPGTGPDALEKVARRRARGHGRARRRSRARRRRGRRSPSPEAARAKIEPEPEPATEPETVAKTVTEMGSESETSSEPERPSPRPSPRSSPSRRRSPSPRPSPRRSREPASEPEFEPEAVAEAEPEPEPARRPAGRRRQLPRAHLLGPPPRGSDPRLLRLLRRERRTTSRAFAKQITIDEVEDGGVMTATLEAPRRSRHLAATGSASPISAWNSVGGDRALGPCAASTSRRPDERASRRSRRSDGQAFRRTSVPTGGRPEGGVRPSGRRVQARDPTRRKRLAHHAARTARVGRSARVTTRGRRLHTRDQRRTGGEGVAVLELADTALEPRDRERANAARSASLDSSADHFASR